MVNCSYQIILVNSELIALYNQYLLIILIVRNKYCFWNHKKDWIKKKLNLVDDRRLSKFTMSLAIVKCFFWKIVITLSILTITYQKKNYKYAGRPHMALLEYKYVWLCSKILDYVSRYVYKIEWFLIFL